ncbi:MAG: LPXTG cell wall anchor domain-containing protein [Mycobacteriales bacterium]
MAATFVVASGGVVLADIQPAAAAPQSFTVHISNNQDNGHHGAWAFLQYDRTVTFTPTPGVTGEYGVLLTDKGTFKTIDGAQSPREGVTMTEQTGTFTGHFSFTVTSRTAPSLGSVKTSYDYKCDGKGNDRFKSCPGMPASTSNWPALFLGGTPGGDGKDVTVPAGVQITAGDYSWIYKTCVEQWTDASTNNDGQADSAGDITGKACPPSPSPTPSDTGSAPAGQGGGAGNLPTTGTSVVLLMVIGGALIVVGAVAMSTSRRRGRMH